jgi:hypothetical protein
MDAKTNVENVVEETMTGQLREGRLNTSLSNLPKLELRGQGQPTAVRDGLNTRTCQTLHDGQRSRVYCVPKRNPVHLALINKSTRISCVRRISELDTARHLRAAYWFEAGSRSALCLY